MNETHKVRLADVCEAILTGPFGSSLHQSDYISNGIPIINPQNIVNGRIVPDADKTVGEETRSRLSEFTVRENDIVIARRGEMGRCAIVTAEMNGWLCGTGSFVIRVNSSALASFVALAISSPKAKEFLEENAIGVTLKNLNQQVLGDLEIPLSPLEEQRRIVAEIEGYQKVLDGARQILAGYKPKLEVNPEWPLVELGDVCRLYQPKTITSQDLVADGPYIVFGANGVIGRYTEFNHEQPEVLMTCRGATCGTINMSSEKCWITGNAMVATPLDARIEKRFLFYILQASDLSETISGSAQPQITRQSLSPFEIPLPPLSEQRRLVAELDAEAAQMDSVRSLLPRFEAKIQRVLDRVWGNTPKATE